MIWGYGTGGRGPWRVAQMLSHPNAEERIKHGAELVVDTNLERVYMYFRHAGRGKLALFGPSFMTKFFYVVGAASGLNPMPLILDDIVAKSMDILAADGDFQIRQTMQMWWSNNEEANARGYTEYVLLVNAWASVMKVRPDAIEMLLFNKPSKFVDYRA